METFLIRLLQFILAISLLVLLHEGGHMFFSKLFGVRVEKFFIFFDISIGKWTGKIFSWKPKKDDTEYGMGWLPLGGYCKISGMIDESMDTEQMKQPPQGVSHEASVAAPADHDRWRARQLLPGPVHLFHGDVHVG